MAAGMTKGGGRTTLSEINVTPLVDVMLLLLIIFMVTAPMLEQGVEVDLPETRAQTLESTEQKLILTVDKERRIYLAGRKIPLPDLVEKLKTNRKLQIDKELYLHADKRLPYGFVVEIMARIKDAGVEELGMITDPMDLKGSGE